MRRRRGIVLPSVLAALVIMAMIVAISAQRALVAARLGGLIAARADLAAAVAAAQAAALEAAADSVDGARMTQGAQLDAGETTAGAAQASWRIVGAAAPFALVEIDARAPLLRGVARERRRALVTLQSDSSGGSRWVPAGSGGWMRMPVP